MPAEHAYVPNVTPTTPLLTAEELLHTSIPNKHTELVRGHLIVREPPGGRHGSVTANLGARLWARADRTGAGVLFVGDTGFTLARNPDTVRGPDIAFVRKERLPAP
ncbi:MAG: Uma2 family endonuclease, partial [Gemmatimonadales bacterium]